MKNDNNDTEEGEGTDKEESEGDDKGVPLLDQPLEQSGTRERKKVQRYTEDNPPEIKEVCCMIKPPFTDLLIRKKIAFKKI